MCHTLNYKMSGLITERHNELRDGVANLSGQSFTPVDVRDDPKIFTGRAVQRDKSKAIVKGKGAPPP